LIERSKDLFQVLVVLVFVSTANYDVVVYVDYAVYSYYDRLDCFL
jgi:hypothetical protein